MSTSIVFARRCSVHCVASACSTCVVPMASGSVPIAPSVVVWLSAQATVIPGCTSPSSGPITCTMPWRASSGPKTRMPWRAHAATRPATTSTAGAGPVRGTVNDVRVGRQ